MEVILDELTPVEFFDHGGVAKVSFTNKIFMEELDLKKKYTFFDYKSYSRFFRNLYLKYAHNHSELGPHNAYKKVNDAISMDAFIGRYQYVIDLTYDNLSLYDMAKFYYYSDKKSDDISSRDPFGIKNVCFSCAKEEFKNWDELKNQRLTRGFDDTELWYLDGTIAKFIYPRLQAFRMFLTTKQMCPEDMDFDTWVSAIDTMIEGFGYLASDEEKTEQEVEISIKALKLFADLYSTLWL